MKNLIIVVCVLIAFLFITNECMSDVPIASVAKKVLVPDWLKKETLRYGTLIAFSINGVMDGLVESYKFSGKFITTDDNYHIFRYGQDISAYATGWMSYAVIRSDKMKFWEKTRVIIGSALIRRNCYEWIYRANRLGDPFNYSDVSSNRKAIVYIKWNGHKFVDAYIGGVGAQGVLIDMICLGLGVFLIK